MLSSNLDYRDENELVNLIIGLTYPRAKFPHPLYDLGFRVKSIEKSFVNSEGRTIKPDIIIASENRGYLIIFEAKSGKNADEEQLENYFNIQDDDLVMNAGFNNDLITNGFDISYVCYKITLIDGEQVPGFNNLIKSIRNKYPFPVVIYDKQNCILALKYFKFKDKQVNDLFENLIRIPRDRIPDFINLNQHSDIEEIKIEAIRSIINYIYDGKFVFTVTELLNDIISPFPGFSDLIGAEAKTAIKGKLKRILKKIGEEKPDYFEWEEGRWRINEKLADLHYSQLNALFNLVKSVNISEGQLTLFDKLE